MLTPGDTWLAVAGTGHEASKFWNAFFNPTYWPSLLLRVGVCTSLAGVWALITSSRMDGDKEPALKTSMVKWSVKWLVPSFVATPFLLVWYLFMVPASQRALLTLGIDTINSGTFSTVTRIALIIIITSATIIGVAYFLAYRNPTDFNLSHAMAVLLLALMATGAGEYGREMLRKPYVIGRWMYSNGVRVPYVSRINAQGLSGRLELGLERCRHRHRPATRAAKPSSAANAVPATPSTATGRLRNCSTDATAPHQQLHRHAARVQSRLALPRSCRPWWEPSRTSTT